MAADFLGLMELERPETQQVVLLRMEGLTQEYIAKLTGTTKQAVSKKINRLTELREMLKDVGRKTHPNIEYEKPIKNSRIDRAYDIQK